jgi:hypothetical protein
VEACHGHHGGDTDVERAIAGADRSRVDMGLIAAIAVLRARMIRTDYCIIHKAIRPFGSAQRFWRLLTYSIFTTQEWLLAVNFLFSNSFVMNMLQRNILLMFCGAAEGCAGWRQAAAWLWSGIVPPVHGMTVAARFAIDGAPEAS